MGVLGVSSEIRGRGKVLEYVKFEGVRMGKIMGE